MKRFPKAKFYNEVSKERYSYLLDYIKAMRRLCNLTQLEASSDLNIDRSELTNYENGVVNIPLYRFIIICVYYRQFVEQNHIELTEQVIKLEKLCSFI